MSKKVSEFDQQWNKSLSFNCHIVCCLNRAYANLNLETKIVQISEILNKIYYFEVDHSELYKPNLAIFGQSIFRLVPALE